MTTTIYALRGRHRSSTARHYYTTEAAARAALPNLVLEQMLHTPIVVEAIEVHGPDADLLTPAGCTHLATLWDLRADLRDALGLDNDRGIIDATLVEHTAAAVRHGLVEPEHEQRRMHVIEAATVVRDWWTLGETRGAKERALVDAVDALREYAPAETVAPDPVPPAERAVVDAARRTIGRLFMPETDELRSAVCALDAAEKGPQR